MTEYIVIQCAATKIAGAASLTTLDGRPVRVIAMPHLVPAKAGVLHAHPDDASDRPGCTWRDVVVEANTDPSRADWRPAGRLYRHPAYAALLERFGVQRTFILSAGWGLVRADYKLPDYDVTFATAAEPWLRRGASDRFADFNGLASASPGRIIFLGGKAYLPPFLRLTEGLRHERLIFYNSEVPPRAPGCALRRFPTARRTNWHYEAALALAGGRLPAD